MFLKAAHAMLLLITFVGTSVVHTTGADRMRLDASVCSRQQADARVGHHHNTAEDRAVAQQGCACPWHHKPRHVDEPKVRQAGQAMMCMLLGVAGVVARMRSWQ
jgi:hypothetical protein